MSELLQDVRYGCRWLLAHRGFALVATSVLALGIAANAAIFTLVHAVLLRPLPYADADRVVLVWQDFRQRGGRARDGASASDIVDWQRHPEVFQHVAAIAGWAPSLTDPTREPEQLSGARVTADYFTLLGVPPLYGRGFTADEDRQNGPRAVVLGHALWQRRFGGDPGLLGRTVTLSGEPHTVVGIMPPDFRPAVVQRAELWRPAQLNPRSRAIVLNGLARLRPDVTLAQANATLTTVAARIAEERPDRQRVGLVAQPLHDSMTGSWRAPLLVLWGGVGFVLLIACANIANLLLARGSTRVREVAVRSALGAGRGRLIRQLITESLLLAVAGGVGGLLLAWWGTEALLTRAPGGGGPGGVILDHVRIDGATLVFALGLMALTALLFGLAPAVQLSRADVGVALKEGGRGSIVPAGGRARRAFIVAQMALALVLLTGAGLLLRSVLNLYAVDLGFDPRRVATASVLLPPREYGDRARQIAFLDQLVARLQTLPGVRVAGVGSVIPLGGGETDSDIVIEGQPPPGAAEDGPVSWYRQVSAGYFAALRMTPLQGRLFTDAEPAPVAVINETLARRYWAGGDPVGARIRFAGPTAPWYTIVGVVRDFRQSGPEAAARAEMFLPYRHEPFGGIRIVARTDGDPALLGPAIAAVVTGLDRHLPVTRVTTMEMLLGDAVAQPRFLAELIGLFAATALALAALGVYGIVSFSVAQRRGEIAVRLALGAERRQVSRLVVGEMAWLAGAGVLLGLGGALLAARAIGGLLFGVTPMDPLTFGLTALVLATAALLAAWLPARRAARIDPVAALRAE